MEIKELMSKYRKRKLRFMKERREYYCDYAHNWVINMCREIIRDLKKLNTTSKAKNIKNSEEKE